MLRWMLAAIHLLGFGIGLGSAWARARSLSAPLVDTAGFRRVFAADNWWGLSALILIATGLWRLLGQTEKPTAYYLANHVFYAKMGFLVAILLLELWPMVTLIRWRAQVGKGALPDPSPARTIAKISYAQVLLLIGMLLAATGMARGIGS